MSRKTIRLLAVAAKTALLGACVNEPLDVDNNNSPDVSRVYASPTNVETTVSQLFKNMYNGLYGNAESLWPGSMTMSFESHSQLGNFGMGARAAIPRNPIDNSLGNTNNVAHLRVFDQLSRNAKS